MRPLPQADQPTPDNRRRLKRRRPVAPAPQKPKPRILPETRDREFLPAALAIIESPPSPIRIWLMLTICAFAAGSLGWAFFGEINIIATAKGKIEPSGHAKVIEPLETGKVTEVTVKNGTIVKAGSVLIRLDAREAEADVLAARTTAVAAEAEALRRSVAIATVKAFAAEDPATNPSLDVAPVIAWAVDIPPATRAREEMVLAGDLTELRSTLLNLADQRAEKQAAVDQLAGSLEAEAHLRDVQAQRVDMRQALNDQRIGSKVDLIDALQTLKTTEAEIASDTGKETQARAALASLQSDRRHTIEAFLSDQTRKAADARRTLDEKRAELAKAEARLDHMTLTAPIDGVVAALAITTQGQVVTSGQEVMRIVPTGDSACSGQPVSADRRELAPTNDCCSGQAPDQPAGMNAPCVPPIEVQAYVTNDDIGFVSPGAPAVIKIDSFPYTRYGTIAGTVETVASDAIPVDQANAGLTDPTRAADPASRALTPGAKPMTDLVFETNIKLSQKSITISDKHIPLTPGMTVTVEIRTGSRKIIDYLISPLVEVTGTAMRER